MLRKITFAHLSWPVSLLYFIICGPDFLSVNWGKARVERQFEGRDKGTWNNSKALARLFVCDFGFNRVESVGFSGSVKVIEDR
jgi:hypothetical protein